MFSWPFLGFHTYFKIPIASLTLEKSALPWSATLAALFMTISNRKVSAHGAAGVPVAWLGYNRVCKDICICIPPSKLQRDATQRKTLIGHSL